MIFGFYGMFQFFGVSTMFWGCFWDFGLFYTCFCFQILNVFFIFWDFDQYQTLKTILGSLAADQRLALPTLYMQRLCSLTNTKLLFDGIWIVRDASLLWWTPKGPTLGASGVDQWLAFPML